MAQTVLITGASRGIGRQMALRFGAAGYRVIVHYHAHETQARALCDALRAQGVDAACYGADVAEEAQVEEMFARAAAEFGAPDVLVNNAGIAARGLLQEMPAEEWDRVFAVDVRGVFLCSRAALRHMLPRHRGAIVNVSSIWGLCGASMEVAYSAAKAAVIGLTKALAQEVGPAGVRVNCLCPGVIDTEMNAGLREEDLDALRAQTPLGRIGTAEEVAGAALFLASSDASFITGQILSPNGGIVL